MARLDWNDFQRLHKGKGWTKQEMSEAWKNYKQHSAVETKPKTTAQNDREKTKNKNEVDACADVSTPTKQRVIIGLTQQNTCQQQQTPYTCSSLTPVSALTISSCSKNSALGKQSPEVQHSSKPYAASSRPSVTPSPGSRLPAPEVARLRAALGVLLSGEKAVQRNLRRTEQVPFCLATDNSFRPAAHGSCAPAAGLSSTQGANVCGPPPPQQQQPPLQNTDVSVGCLGMHSSGVLTWNGFQKLCKGKGMKQSEQSAAWKHYKATGELPQRLQQDLDAVRTQALLHQQGKQQQQQQKGPTKWDAVKEWVVSHSRAGSRAVSRVVSRAVSRAVSRVASPEASPQSIKGPQAAAGRDQQVRQQGQSAGIIDTRCIEHDTYHTSLQHAFAAAAAADPHLDQHADSCCSSSHCVAEQMLEPDDQLDHWQQQQQHMLDMQILEAQSQQKWQPQAVCNKHLKVPDIVSQPIAVDAAAGLAAELQHWPAGSSAMPDTTRTAAGRLLRELLPDDCQDLFAGFTTWTHVSITPAILKQLKRKIPAQPGVYEWGARMPLANSTHGNLGKVALGATAREVMGVAAAACTKVEYGPIVCFYMGKAGEVGRVNSWHVQRD